MTRALDCFNGAEGSTAAQNLLSLCPGRKYVMHIDFSLKFLFRAAPDDKHWLDTRRFPVVLFLLTARNWGVHQDGKGGGISHV